ncbi:MAG: TolC family outer membrane protein [Sulfuritalea sp.]|nr:TolC family outer membrane protein [Sulfuritalea sp.]MDP1985403.1 TolC family outer membrane protein [Sulfuritalea sp.]
MRFGNRSNTRAWALLALALGGIGCFPAYGEDLAQVYALSRDSDPKFKAGRYEFEAVGFAEPQALAALLPTITLEGTQTDTRQRIISSANAVFGSGLSLYPTRSTTLTLTQPIFKLSAWRGYEQAQTKVKQAAANFGAIEQDMMLRAATAYLSVLAARDAYGFAEAERDAIKRQLDLVQQRFSSGLVARVGLHDAKARHALKEADVVAARNDLDDKLQALREMTGKLVVSLKPLREDIPLEQPEPADIGKWVESAQQQNLLLLARRHTVEIAQQEVGRQRAGHAPVVDLVATQNGKVTGGSLFGGGSNVETTDVMFRVTLPIYSGGGTSALTEEAARRYQASLEDLERDARQVERQTRAAFQGVTGGTVRVKALAQGVVSSLSARELKLEGYKSGLETILQVLDAERDLYAAKRDSARARYDYLLNRLRLKQAVGTLSEEDLLEINKLMQ